VSDGRHEATASVTVRQESKVLQSVYSSISEMSSSGSDEVSRDMDDDHFAYNQQSVVSERLGCNKNVPDFVD
jgi:hypothetical protein